MRRHAVLGLAVCWLWHSLEAQETASQEPLTRFGVTVTRSTGLRGEVFAIPRGTAKLPRFARLQSLSALYTNTLDVPPTAYTNGFPGVAGRIDWFAIDYKGQFWIEHAGKYQFSLASDDGSKLYIDGRTVIRNDGIHPCQSREGTITLAAGRHQIRVGYFQGPGGGIALVLRVARPGERWRIFNTDDFLPPSGSND
jgi:hypothetical protein